jgi:hypothetical protein
MDMPVFDVSDPNGWVLQMERYFTINQSADNEQVESAIIAFDGDVLTWWNCENKRKPVERWKGNEDSSFTLSMFI